MTAPDTVALATAPTRADGSRPSAFQLFLRSPVSVVGSIVLLVMIAAALLGPALAPYGVNETDIAGALKAPSAEHWFGTDDLGRDVFSRVVIAAQVSLRVAVISVAIALVLGVLLGIVSGYAGGWADGVLMRIVDVMFAFPMLILALAIVAVLGPGANTATIAIGVVYVPIFARVARASTLSVRSEPFVRASQTMGTGAGRILVKHILPNISGPIIVQTSLSLAFAILSEAALSFLGLGVQPPQPSWGRMLFEAQSFLGTAWWLAVFPGLAIFLTVLSCNLVGDGLRDVLDPKQRSVIESRSARR
ncbi:Glutathione transport system permease protein GsiD [Leucobacter aridicollis]|uniref:Peptide/nickel transport system permease protein n=1 Tax=Leucobacter aridicollis TaxID=283878 RepID=A0A852R4U2_9MICO|nr:ABC transporter permease [Leucobacter aridicollis]MCS3427329.1 peptide/nickel transport system permease protein [Leucobacter aridicollis]NYD27787.1 peptide/nickel transport system permease protein [Leucobacter aridicollis]RKQ84510.1 peptide/nickel transport system permease protein [Mycolicibacterium mucogenicum 261Sha1.1M5]